VNAFVSRVLYRDVVLATHEQCVRTLGMLADRPRGAVARHLRALEVRPHGGADAYSYRAAYAVADAVEHLAPRMDALQAFAWDADEAPPCPAMWLALRLS
jgi:hypothetical protein